MSTFDDSQKPYYDRFAISNRWSKILYRPGRPLQSSEMNEMQSMLQNQIALLGNTQFSNGSIISGMGLISEGTKATTSTTTLADDVNKNLITYDTLTSVNSKIDTSNWKTNGEVDVVTTASMETNYPGLEFTVANVKRNTFTISFTVKRVTGTLYKMSGIFPDTLKVDSYLVDGKTMKTTFDDATASPLLDVDAKQINLSDGNTHTFVVTFKGSTTDTSKIDIVANAGYNALNEGATNFNLTYVKAESGDTATAWNLADADVDMNDKGDRNKIMRVLDGYIFLDGQIRKFNQTDIGITGIGKETIGVKLDESPITAQDDNSLLDPATGVPSQWAVGADRLQYDVELTYNDTTATDLFVLQDGKTDNDVVKPDYAKLNDMLAKRTNDESGSYRVEGLNLWSKTDQHDSSVVDVIVDAGTAYVLGYQIIKGNPTTITVPKAVGTEDMKDEVFIYFEKSSVSGQLANQPVQTVNRVSGNVLASQEAVNRNSSTAVNDVLKNQAYQIDKVTWTDTKKKVHTYEQGVDFKLVNGNELTWDMTDRAQEPPQGATYYVDYEYQKIFKENTDYRVIYSGNAENETAQVTFANMTGDKPIEGSQVHVSYTYFLARVDAITLDKKGDFTLIQGQPAKLPSAQAPTRLDPLTLRIGYVTVFPNSDKAICQQSTVTRIPFIGLQDLVSRVDILEKNSEQSALNASSMINQDPVTLANTFSDNFTAIDKADVGNRAFTASYLFDQGAITVPVKASTALQPNLLDTASQIHKFSHMVTTPFTERILASQENATGTKNVNPYQVFRVLGQLKINPEVDNWIDEKNTMITTSNGVDQNVTQGRWWVAWDENGSGTSQSQKDLDNQVTLDDGRNLGQLLDSGIGWGAQNSYSGTVTKNLGTRTVESEAQYIRPQTVSFKAENLIPLEDNLEMKFDNQHVDVTPAYGYGAGTTKGTIKANSNGIAEGSFMIPDGIKTGVREVVLSNPNVSATTTYTAQGTVRNNQNMVQRSRVTVNFSDPLAQSFGVEEDSIITSVDLYFATKPESNSETDTTGKVHRSDIIVQLRTLGDEGSVSRTILAETTLSADAIQISDDASAATHVPMPDPVQVKNGDSLAIVIITDSAEYNMYIATAGASTLDGQLTLGQPYVNGTLFYSSNGQTWTAQQDSDLKFKVNAGTFESSGVVAFDSIKPRKEVYRDGAGNPILDKHGKQIPMDINELVLLINYLTPANTGMSWQIKILSADEPDDVTIDDMVWEPLNADTEVDLVKDAREIQFRANFAASKYMSPILATDSLSLAAFLMHTAGTYISRTTATADTRYNHLRVQYDAYLPGKSTVKLYFSIDGGATWNDTSAAYTKISPVDKHYNQYAYDMQLYEQSKGVNKMATSIKFRIDLTAQSTFQRPLVRRLLSSMSIQDGNETGDQGWNNPTKGTIVNPTNDPHATTK